MWDKKNLSQFVAIETNNEREIFPFFEIVFSASKKFFSNKNGLKTS